MKLFATLFAVLIPLTVPAIAQEQGENAPATVPKLIEKLGDTAYQARQHACKMLEEMGDKAVEALKNAAENHEDPEVRWRARQLADLIQRKAAGLVERQGPQPLRDLPGAWRNGDLDKMFELLFERLERDFGIDVPQRSFFHDPFFLDLRQQIEELQKKVKQTNGADVGTLSRSVQLRIGPEGVELRIHEGSDDQEGKVYSAPSLEAFRQRYPEIARTYIGETVHGLQFEVGPNLLIERMPAVVPQEATAEKGPHLGIVARRLTAELRAFLALPVDRGLFVESVQPESLAMKLGLQEHDVLLEVNGKSIGDAADVRSALRGGEGPVTALVNRKGEEKALQVER